nr:hypothetical protein [Candidatus Njordarchaeota archaeon]
MVLNSSARNPARRVLVAELWNRNSRVFYDKEEYVKLLQGALDHLFPKCIREANNETSLHEVLLRKKDY